MSATARKSRAKPTAMVAVPLCVSRGSGMTAGLEIWRVGQTLHLYDRTLDNRFAADVATWTTASGGLNAAALHTIKDASTTSINGGK